MSSNDENNSRFDFITDAELRASLESDYVELSNCMAQMAWKGVHVLAGSVVEAILVDYLMGIDYQKKSGKDPLKMELGPLIAACKEQKIITDRTADLSAVVKSYRNLIHPGRVVRLSETVDANSAAIAKALVELIAAEVANTKKESYGFTAEQISNKIAKDKSAFAVLSHFLKDMKEAERERLVKEVIPNRYFQEQYEGFITLSAPDYEKFHSQTFATLTEDSKMRVAKKFVKILREESGEYVHQYENLFFRGFHLKYLPSNEIPLVKAHLLARLRDEQSEDVLTLVQGLAGFLAGHEIALLVDALVRMMAFAKDENVQNSAQLTLLTSYSDLEEGQQKELIERVDYWINLLAKRGAITAKAELEGIKTAWTEEIPF